MLAKSKLSSIETLVSQALIDMEISHKEFTTILKAKDKYEKMKENVRNMNEKLEEKQENMRLQPKIIKYFTPSKKFYFFCVCIKWLILGKKHMKTTT